MVKQSHPEPVPDVVRVKTSIPPIYRPPTGGPLYWRDEQSGHLKAAIMAYLDYQIGEGPLPTEEQCRLIGDYLQHWICAPCWNASAREDSELARELVTLRLMATRDRAQQLTTCEQFHAFLHRCLALGIDPL